MKWVMKFRNGLQSRTRRKRLERSGEIVIADGTNGFGFDFVDKTES